MAYSRREHMPHEDEQLPQCRSKQCPAYGAGACQNAHTPNLLLLPTHMLLLPLEPLLLLPELPGKPWEAELVPHHKL